MGKKRLLAVLALGLALGLTSSSVAAERGPWWGNRVKWIRLCNLSFYAMGEEGLLLKLDRPYPPDMELMEVAYRGNTWWKRQCVDYLFYHESFPNVAMGGEPPLEEPTVSLLTPGQPMFRDAVTEALRAHGQSASAGPEAVIGYGYCWMP